MHDRLPLADAEHAHGLVKSRGMLGKVVLIVDEQLARARPDRAAST